LVNQPKPHPALLTRPLGVGQRWLAVSTLAAAGSALDWAWRTMYSELDRDSFYKRVPTVLKKYSSIRVDPHLAGSRVEIDERTGAITNLRLSDGRDDILAALCQALSRDSAERIDVLRKQYGRILRTVAMTGGVQKGLSDLLHREWAKYGKWEFRPIDHATLRGLWRLV
jgi:sugar (pentulose or hexulose) kinase